MMVNQEIAEDLLADRRAARELDRRDRLSGEDARHAAALARADVFCIGHSASAEVIDLTRSSIDLTDDE